MLTVLSKFLTLHYLQDFFGHNYNFWGSRQVFTSVLDNFVFGMSLGYVERRCRSPVRSTLSAVFCALLSLFLIYAVWTFLGPKGIHTDDFYGYTFHTFLALSCTGFVYFASSVSLSQDFISHNFAAKFLLWLSKYSYEIYILHYAIACNLMAKSPLFMELKGKHRILAYAGLYLAAILAGVVLKKLSAQVKISRLLSGKRFLVGMALTTAICVGFIIIQKFWGTNR